MYVGGSLRIVSIYVEIGVEWNGMEYVRHFRVPVPARPDAFSRAQGEGRNRLRLIVLAGMEADC